MMQDVSEITPAAEPDPIALAVGTPLIPFPTEAFPPFLERMVTSAALALQVDAGATATSALSVLSAACGGRAFIQLKPGWVEPVNLYTATIADPGERKSSTQEAMTTGLAEAETELDDRTRDDRHRLAYERDVAAKAFEKAKIEAGRADAGRDRELALDLVKQESQRLLELEVPAQPQIIYGDLTPEATAIALQEQGGKMAVITAEGGLFGTLAGRYSGGQANVDVFTQGYSGETVRVKRVGRDDVRVPRACVTLGLMIQPEVMREVGGNKALTGRGLIDRFLFCEPKSLIGQRNNRSAGVPIGVKAEYDRCVKDLVLDLERALADDGAPVTLTLSPDAQELFYGAMDDLEERMGPDGELHEIRGWTSKHAGRIGRIAALLHLSDPEAAGSVVSPDTVKAACRIGRYYMVHAWRAYSQMRLDPDTEAAVYLQQRLRAHFRCEDAGDAISVREIQRLCRKFKTKDDLEPALQRLEDNGWIFPLDVKPEGPGRPSAAYSVHPMLLPKPDRTEAA